MVPARPGEVGFVEAVTDRPVDVGRAGAMPHREAEVSERLYRQAESSQLQWARQAAENNKIYNGVHWTQEQRDTLLDRGQQPIAIQAMYQIVQQAVGMLTANDPRFNAAAREDSDTKTAAAVRHLLQWGWQKSEGRKHFKQAILDYYVQGRGHLYVHIDPNEDFGKGEVKITSLDPKEVFPDPNSRDPLWDDAAYIFIRRIFTRAQIHQMWPHFDFSGVPEEDSQPFSSSTRFAHNEEQIHREDLNLDDQPTYEVLERFHKVRVRHWRLYNPHNGRDEILDDEQFSARLQDIAFIVINQGEEKIVTDKSEVFRWQGHFDAYGAISHLIQPEAQFDPNTGEQIQEDPFFVPGPEGSFPTSIPGTEITLIPTNIDELVKSEVLPTSHFLLNRIRVIASIGGKLLYEPFVLRTSHYPVIVFPNGFNRNPYPISDVARTRDLQDVINKTNSLILAHASNVTNMKVFYPIGAITDIDHYESEWAKAGTAFLPYDPQNGERGGIVFATPQPLPTELYNNVDRALAMMERIMGVFSLMQGDPTQAPQTFKGTMAIDEFGARRMKSKMDDIYASLARLGSVWIELAQGLYTEEKVARIIQPDGSVDEQELNALQYDDFGNFIGRLNDITVGHYDVIIQGGSTLPSDRWAMLETYQQLFTLGLVDQVAVLKRAEIPDADGILERAGLMQQMQQQLAFAEEEIKKLRGDLQTAQREELNARQRVEVEKFKSGLKGVESDVRASQRIFDVTGRQEMEKRIAIANAIDQSANGNQ